MQRGIQNSLNNSPKLMGKLVKGLHQAAPGVTETYVMYGYTAQMYESCALRADYTIPDEQRMKILAGTGPHKTADGVDLGEPTAETAMWWYVAVGLQPTFSTWAQVTLLHMYILTVALRSLTTASEFQGYHRYLIEHFSNSAEDKMAVLHNMTSRTVRNKYLKDLFLQWRGILAAYDEGLVKGDAVLAGAVWRNVFRGQEDVDWAKVALVVAFMRRAINSMHNRDVLYIIQNMNGKTGLWGTSQSAAQAMVSQESQGIKEPLTE